ncbi:uncharacterized protein LOC135136942 [Zophobas morio]|uniref:uncharacterized protein LOC135136942 n=1 Tax=Zophobas morio TaxID=2755281 RepID=UPI0030830240
MFNLAAVEDTPNTVNILLMGETGVGKSTFVNSFANYIRTDDFEKARKLPTPLVLIPTRCTVYGTNSMEGQNLTVGFDENETQDVGSSATQCVKNYMFPLEGENLLLRFIDTPGLGDTAGPDKDDKHCEAILSYLSQLDKINAICLVMKPLNDRNTVHFSYCVRRILSQLHKSACDNLIFLFTNTKGSDYTPGSTFALLKEMKAELASKPPFVNIPLEKNNVFCLDNECFKHLLALNFKIELFSRTLESCVTSWQISCEEIVRFIRYVQNLPAHNVKRTISINETKELILKLSKPLFDICQLMQENITILNTKEQESARANQTIEELKRNLYKPVVDIEIVKLENSAMVCTGSKCVDKLEVGQITKSAYRTRCHEKCFLSAVTYDVVGHWLLATCSKMYTFRSAPSCKHCGCSYKLHMITFYDTKLVEKSVFSEDVVSDIDSETKQLQKLQECIDTIKREKGELQQELDYISECTAKFACFLQNNAITSSYDSFHEYVYLSLQREKSLGDRTNQAVVNNLTEILTRHENLVKVLKEKLSRDVDRTEVTAESLYKDAQELFNLKHAGPKIKEIFDARAACMKNAVKPPFKTVVAEKIPKWFFKRGTVART